MLRIEAFQPEHILQLVPREPDKSTLDMALPEITKRLAVANEYVKRGVCWTGFAGDTPVFCCGMVILWPGVAEGWAYTSELVKKYPLSFHRAVLRLVDICMSKHELFRLQISIPKTHTVSGNWAFRLGFKREGILRQYGPDRSDWCRYTRLKPRPRRRQKCPS